MEEIGNLKLKMRQRRSNLSGVKCDEMTKCGTILWTNRVRDQQSDAAIRMLCAIFNKIGLKRRHTFCLRVFLKIECVTFKPFLDKGQVVK